MIQSNRHPDHDAGGSYYNPGGDHDARPEPARELKERTEHRITTGRPEPEKKPETPPAIERAAPVTPKPR